MGSSFRNAVVTASLAAAALSGRARAEERAPAPSGEDRAWTLSVGTGAGGLVEFADGLVGDVSAGLAGYTTERSGRLQANARVDREHGPWIRTGIAYTHQRWEDEYFSAPGASQGTVRDAVHVLVADFTLRWVHGRDVELYSGVAAGGALRRERGTVAGTRYREEEALFAFQLRLLGLSLGGERVRAFAEVGVGFEGLLVAGVALRL